MSMRVQSSGCPPWGFFILSRFLPGRWHRTVSVVLVSLGVGGIAWATVIGSVSDMKRRQQGILTGMPFMAHVSQRSFVDDLGRRIFLAKPPVRIVSLAPSVTETLFALGAGDQIVGVTQFCDYPVEAQTKPKVGYPRPNLESLVALQPDLILAPHEFIHPDVLAKLEQLKIAVFVIDAKTVEDIVTHVTTVGRMLERTGSANDLAARIRHRFADIKSRTSAFPKRRVLYVLNSEPLLTVSQGSFIHQMIEVAGGVNIAGHSGVPYPRLSMEEVLKQDPEVILFPVGKAETVSDEEQRAWRRWTSMSAVKQGRFAGIPSDLVNRPGPRIGEGLEALARAIHPEALTP